MIRILYCKKTKNVWRLMFALCFCFLPFFVFGQSNIIKRKPTSKPKTERKTSTPKRRQATNVNGSSTRQYVGKSELERSSILKNLINNMVYVQGGTFTMGATSEQGSEVDNDEKNIHQVTLSSFYIGRYEVKQKEWKAVMGNNPSYFTGDNRPVENVSWDDCQTFINRLNSLTGRHFRLPTEAEWEYAARGGNSFRGYKYSGSSFIDNVAWYGNNSGNETHDVGTKSPNELGLYDMSGNVWEWCQDWYGNYSSSAKTNPKGPYSGSSRILRGGGSSSFAKFGRVSSRGSSDPNYNSKDIGLRLAL